MTPEQIAALMSEFGAGSLDHQLKRMQREREKDLEEQQQRDRKQQRRQERSFRGGGEAPPPLRFLEGA
jgi:hypothetical protein